VENYPLAELKLIYRVLHRHLGEHVELLDARFFDDLQRHLQRKAQEEGVDVADHGAWDAWLGNAPLSCAVRVPKRSVLS
jgi:hypothetical protein